MRIGLIDVDSHNFPNIALMKISAWHKAKGDEVGWYSHFEGAYDFVYCSKVFSFTQDFDEPINASKVIRGGTGYCIDLVDGREVFRKGKEKLLIPEAEHIYPDYSLYPKLTEDTAYGFLTRGCPRGCEFCIVGQKEGLCSHKVADLSEFWRGQKNIVLCDPNILACKDWKDLLQQLIDSKANIDINQGLDIRLMTEEKAEMISRMRIHNIHFAWDKYEDREKIIPKFELFGKYRFKGKNPDHNAIVFTLVNFNTTIEQDLDRIYTLRDIGYWPYVMIYDKAHADPIYTKLQRWVNNRFIFARCKRFEDYNIIPKQDNNLTLF